MNKYDKKVQNVGWGDLFKSECGLGYYLLVALLSNVFWLWIAVHWFKPRKIVPYEGQPDETDTNGIAAAPARRSIQNKAKDLNFEKSEKDDDEVEHKTNDKDDASA